MEVLIQQYWYSNQKWYLSKKIYPLSLDQGIDLRVFSPPPLKVNFSLFWRYLFKLTRVRYSNITYRYQRVIWYHRTHLRHNFGLLSILTYSNTLGIGITYPSQFGEKSPKRQKGSFLRVRIKNIPIWATRVIH